MLASLGNRSAVATILGVRISGFFAWVLWRAVYLGKLPSMARKLEVVGDWLWNSLFSPNIVQLQLTRSGVGLAHYAPGDFVFHKGDPAGSVFAIESGTAGVYLDESAQPVSILKPGDPFGEVSAGKGRRIQPLSIKAETPLDLITIRRADFDRVAQTIPSIRAMVQKSEEALAGYEALLTMAREQPRFASLTARDVMSSPPETLSPDTTLRQAARLFSGGKFGYPVVDENGRLEGYCGRAELFSALRGARPLNARIQDFMRRDSPFVSENQGLLDASVVLLREDMDLLPVTSMDGSGRVVGVMTPLDVILKVIEPLSSELNRREPPDERKLA